MSALPFGIWFSRGISLRHRVARLRLVFPFHFDRWPRVWRRSRRFPRFGLLPILILFRLDPGLRGRFDQRERLARDEALRSFLPLPEIKPERDGKLAVFPETRQVREMRDFFATDHGPAFS